MTTNILEVRHIANALGGGAAKPAAQIVGELTLDTGAPAMPRAQLFCRHEAVQGGGL